MTHITNVHSNGTPNSVEIYNDQVFIPSNIHQFSKQTDDGTITGY